MEKIVIGLLKSQHPIKLKRQIIEKIIEADKTRPSPAYSFKSLLIDIELIWSIGIDSTPSTTNTNTISNNSTYDTVIQHYDLLKIFFNYFLKFENTQSNIQDLITHLVNLIKVSLMPNLNKENNHQSMRHTYLVLLIWLRLINESYLYNLTNFETCSNFVNLLSTINSNLTSCSPTSLTFLYFIQNDSIFCQEYLMFVKSFLILDDKYNQNDSHNDRIIDFLEKSILDTISLLIRHVIARKINLNLPEQYRANLKIELENLCEIEKLIQLFVSKSTRLYDQTIGEILSLLCDMNPDSNEHLDKKLAQLFQTFDLTRNLPIIYKFFEENRCALAQSENDVYLKNLLFNLISLVSWPFAHKIDEWICSIMTILAIKHQKFQLLISVSEQKCEYILTLLNQKNINDSALNIFSFFLINYKHSPKLFHKICSKVCTLLEYLKFRKLEENDIKAASVYNHIAVIAFICMTRFNGYPQIYKPLLEVVQTDAELSGYELICEKYSIEKVAESLNYLTNEANLKETNKKTQSTQRSFDSTTNKENDVELIEEYQPIKKLGPNLTGLVNLGNTCYLNSIIQSLFSCKKFVKSLVETDVQQLNEASNDYSFFNQLRILFSIMLLTQRPAIKATNFVKHCTPSWFRCGQQQDSSEFLTFLLDNLNEQMKKFDTNMLNLVKKSFGIQLKTECKCANCKSITSRDDVCFYLPLSFSNHLTSRIPNTTTPSTDKKIIPLQTLIDNFFEIEHLSSETGNSYFCSSCNSLQNASKQIFLTRNEEKSIQPPDYLIFTLNRFIYQTNGTVQTNLKIMDIVDYPTKIEINTYNENNILAIETYSLLAIVVHSGSSIHYGHYYTYMVSDSNESNWYLANDSQITQVSFESLTSNQNLFKDDTPYLLFYARVTTTTTTTDLSQIKVPNKKLIEIIEQDNKVFQIEEKNRILKSKKSSKAFYSSKYDEDDDSSGTGGASPTDHCNNDSTRDSGPRVVF